MGPELIGTALSLGILASASPCALPLYPGFLAYLSASTPKLRGRVGVPLLGVTVLLGVLTMMLALGLLIASLSLAAGSVLRVAVPVADALLVALGGLLLFNKNPLMRLPQVSVPLFGNPLLSAYVYGLLYGPITLPCSATLAVSVFALSFTATQLLSKLLLFLVFGLGFGLPLLVLSFLARTRQAWLARAFATRYGLVNRVSGLILVAVGLYDFSVNWPYLRLYFS